MAVRQVGYPRANCRPGGSLGHSHVLSSSLRNPVPNKDLPLGAGGAPSLCGLVLPPARGASGLTEMLT